MRLLKSEIRAPRSKRNSGSRINPARPAQSSAKGYLGQSDNTLPSVKSGRLCRRRSETCAFRLPKGERGAASGLPFGGLRSTRACVGTCQLPYGGRRHMKSDLMRMVVFATASPATQAWLDQPPDACDIAAKQRSTTQRTPANRRHAPPRRASGSRPHPHTERRRGQTLSPSDS